MLLAILQINLLFGRMEESAAFMIIKRLNTGSQKIDQAGEYIYLDWSDGMSRTQRDIRYIDKTPEAV